MRSTGIRLTRNRNRMQILSQIGSYFPNLAGLLILTCLMVLSPPKLLTAASQSNRRDQPEISSVSERQWPPPKRPAL